MTSYIIVNSAHYSNGMSEEGKIIFNHYENKLIKYQ